VILCKKDWLFSLLQWKGVEARLEKEEAKFKLKRLA
jgi:hypothetical protein